RAHPARRHDTVRGRAPGWSRPPAPTHSTPWLPPRPSSAPPSSVSDDKPFGLASRPGNRHTPAMSAAHAVIEPAPALLQVADLHYAYNGVAAVRGVSLEVASGEIVALLGSNGAGKSTTVKVIA